MEVSPTKSPKSPKIRRGTAQTVNRVEDILVQCLSDEDTPVDIQHCLLKTLQLTQNQFVFNKLLPIGEALLKHEESSLSLTHIDMLQLIIERYDEETAVQLQPGSPALHFLLGSLQKKVWPEGRDPPACMVLKQITQEFFHNLPSLESQHILIAAVLDVGEITKSSAITNLIQKTLKHVKLEGKHIRKELSPTTGTAAPATVKGKRRSRSGPDADGTVSWPRLTLLLEAFISRKAMEDSEEVVSLLFGLLSKLQLETDEEVEYRKRLLLSVMHNLTSKWQQLGISPKQESLPLEVLVSCVRSGESPQTQQHALMVMASIAHFFPEYILHNVMSIFTFVGSGLLQQDDAHSLQVVTRSISTLIPALIQAHSSRGTSPAKLELLIAGVLQVFVDARQAVPRHRCLLVFQSLIETLDPQQHLWLVLALLMASAVRPKQQKEGQDGSSGHVEEEVSLDAEMEFATLVCEQFDPVIQVKAATQVMVFLQQLTEVHQVSPQQKKVQKVGAVDISAMLPQDLRLFQFHLTKLVAVLLAKEDFIMQVVGGDAKHSPDFESFVQAVLCYVSCITSVQGKAKSGGKFWKALLSKTYEILDKVNYLLPTTTLLAVVASLLKHDIISIRRKALELLGTKLQQLETSSLSQVESDSLLSIVTELLKMTQGVTTDAASDADDVACCQMALFCLKLLCKLLGSQKPQAFIKLFPVCVKLIAQPAVTPPVLSSTLLCLAELCSVLKAHAIPHLSSFVPPLLATLKNTPLLQKQELVLTCGLTALQRLVTSLPHFLSPYLLDILLVICEVSILVNLDDPSKTSAPAIRLKAIRHNMSTVVASRVLVPALSDCFTTLLASNQNALRGVMLMTKEHVETISREDLSHHQNALVSFFCLALDFRNAKLQLSIEDMIRVEDSTTEAILAMVVRLSESSFRPMFYKLYDWACREDSETARKRKLVFFKLADRLADKLKSLFNLFVRHILQAACKLLDENNSAVAEVTYFGTGPSAVQMSCDLLTHILQCLERSMLHDTEGLFQKDVFTLLMKPLVGQIENELGGEVIFEQRILTSVAPCISQFAVASKDDAAWKSLNYQILLKTRHNSPKVRFAALKVMEAVAQKLGEEYMVLVPETIPFLAELMEDECEEVERQCQRVIASMEEVLGESLQKYF